MTSRERPLGTCLAAYAIFSACGLLAFFTKPNWALAIGLLPLPWAAVTFVNARSRRDFATWAASGAAILLLLTGAAFAYQSYCTIDRPLVNLYYRARALVCFHVPLIRAEIDRRLASQTEDPYRPVLIEMAQVMDDELALSKKTGPGAYPSLGWDADRLFFSSLPNAPRFNALKPAKRTLLCTDLFKSAVRHDPGAYLQKVLKQMPRLFKRPYEIPRISVGRVSEQLAVSERNVNADKNIPQDLLHGYRLSLEQAKREFAAPWPSASRLALSLRASVIFEFLTRTFRWTLGLPILLCAVAAVWPRLRRKIRWRAIAPALCVAVWAVGSVVLSALSTALTQGLDVQRYVQLSVPLTLLSQVLWFLIGVSLLLQIAPALWRKIGERGKALPVPPNRDLAESVA
jgi:hypothetical protein